MDGQAQVLQGPDGHRPHRSRQRVVGWLLITVDVEHHDGRAGQQQPQADGAFQGAGLSPRPPAPGDVPGHPQHQRGEHGQSAAAGQRQEDQRQAEADQHHPPLRVPSQARRDEQRDRDQGGQDQVHREADQEALGLGDVEDRQGEHGVGDAGGAAEPPRQQQHRGRHGREQGHVGVPRRAEIAIDESGQTDQNQPRDHRPVLVVLRPGPAERDRLGPRQHGDHVEVIHEGDVTRVMPDVEDQGRCHDEPGAPGDDQSDPVACAGPS